MILSSIPVHKEQSSEAIFFNPYSPASLSKVLEKKRNSFLRLSVLRKKTKPKPLYKNGMQIFANNFISILKSIR
jgi:hypothetical protein